MIRLLLLLSCMSFVRIVPGDRTQLAKLARQYERQAGDIDRVLKVAGIDASSVTDDMDEPSKGVVVSRDTVQQTVTAIYAEGQQLELIREQYGALCSRFNTAALPQQRVMQDELTRLRSEFETVTVQQQLRLQTIAEDAGLRRACVQERDRLRTCAKGCWETISWIDSNSGGI